MDRRILPGFDAWFHSQHPHLFPASAASTGLPLFRPFQSTPVLLPPLAPMPLLTTLAPIPLMPHSLFPVTSSVPGWGNFQTGGTSSSNHPSVFSVEYLIGHSNSGRANVRMGFSIDDILNSDSAQQPGKRFDVVMF